MKIGFVGLGKMGGNMVARLLDNADNHSLVVFDHDVDALNRAHDIGAQDVSSLQLLVSRLNDGVPRVVWVMVPAGEATQTVLEELSGLLGEGDVIVDGGNSHWRETIARHAMLAAKGIQLVDVGTSGGVHGLQNGYCMMIGGDADAVSLLTPIFDTLAPAYSVPHGDGWAHVGASGAGHYAKMIHNGIEYGMMAAIAEGFALLDASEFDFNAAQLAHLWMQGSVVRSWLMELTAKAFEDEGPELAALEPIVPDSGEGRWTVDEAVRLRVPAPIIAGSLFSRFASQGNGDLSGRLLAALRAQFGGHSVTRRKD